MTTVSLDDITVPAPPSGPADWNDEGVIILPRFISDALIDNYMDEWEAANGFRRIIPPTYQVATTCLDAIRPGGWPDCTPYMRHPHLRRLLCDHRLALVLEGLLGEPAGVHLNLTGWVSTQRNWHQDSYLNPPHVGDFYAAVWIALDDIDPRSGPFQYVPGSHRWRQVTQHHIGRHVDLADPRWPAQSERILTPLFADEIHQHGAPVISYLPAKGDVLIWHGRLLHRGSRPVANGAYRPALIAHYSGIHHRQDMPAAVQHEAGGWYFPIGRSGPVA